jgi:ABC-type glycerol-3-phosphate transport system substrate-binding protein
MFCLGTMGFVDNYLVGAHFAKNDFKKKVALEFLNFTLSPEFQVEVLARGIGSSPVNLNVKNILSKKEIKQFHIDEPEYFKKNRIMWPTLDKRNRNGLKRLWKKAVGKDMKSKKDLKQTKE